MNRKGISMSILGAFQRHDFKDANRVPERVPGVSLVDISTFWDTLFQNCNTFQNCNPLR